LIAAIGAAWFLASGWLLVGMAEWLDVGQGPVATRYVLVLGGDVNSRPFAAAELVKQGWCQQVLLIATVRRDATRHELVPLQHDVAAEILRRQGVPADAIARIPGNVASTRDEAEAAKRFLDSHPTGDCTVVTSFYHTRRARWIFGQLLGDTAGRVHFFSAPPEGFDAQNWWRDARGFEAITSEYLGLVSYAVRFSRFWQVIFAGVPLALFGSFVWRARMRAAGRSAQSDDGAASPSRRARIPARKWLVAVLVLGLVWIGHAAILQSFAGLLVAESPSPNADCLVLRTFDGQNPDGDRAYRVAAELLGTGKVKRVVLLESEVPRSVAIGAAPPFTQLAKQELQLERVSLDAIDVITTHAGDQRQEVSEFGKWMAAHPKTRVLMAVGRTTSRSLRWEIDRNMDAAESARVGLLALPDREFDETNWWRSYRGVKSVVVDAVMTMYVVLVEGD
jgi:uncharacterized SAM-binding protein YcdF (DUF218 family)